MTRRQGAARERPRGRPGADRRARPDREREEGRTARRPRCGRGSSCARCSASTAATGPSRAGRRRRAAATSSTASASSSASRGSGSATTRTRGSALPRKRERQRDMLEHRKRRRAAAHARQDRGADRAAAAGDAGLLHRVRLPDAAAGSVQGRLPCGAGRVHQRGRLHRVEAPAGLLARPVPALRRAAAHRVPARHAAVLVDLPVGPLHRASRTGGRSSAANAYKFPLVVRRRGGTARIWGQARFAPNGATYPVVLQSRAPRLVQMGELGRPRPGDAQPGLLPGPAAERPRGTTWRAVWAEPDFARFEVSREAVAR